MSFKIFLGEWKEGRNKICLSIENDRLFANVNQGQGIPVRCGVHGQASHISYIKKINDFADKKFQEISVFFHSTPELKEVRVFEASRVVAVRLKEIIEKFDLLDEISSIEAYQKILSLFEEALKIQRKKNASVEELEASISKFKIKMLFKEAKDQAHLFLPEESQLIEFNKVTHRYFNDDDPFICFNEEINVQEKPLSLAYHYLAALVKE